MAAPTINTYISDMLALEKHNLQPLQSQASDGELAKFPAAKACVESAVPMVQPHINALGAVRGGWWPCGHRRENECLGGSRCRCCRCQPRS